MPCQAENFKALAQSTTLIPLKDQMCHTVSQHSIAAQTTPYEIDSAINQTIFTNEKDEPPSSLTQKYNSRSLSHNCRKHKNMGSASKAKPVGACTV